MAARCSACRFWSVLLPAVGECRRRPPTVIPDEERGRWPQTQATDWCGEFQTPPRDDSIPDAHVKVVSKP